VVTGVLAAVDEFELMVSPHPWRTSEDEASTARLVVMNRVRICRWAGLAAYNGVEPDSNLIVRHRPIQDGYDGVIDSEAENERFLSTF
jgi:hypothetical protein